MFLYTKYVLCIFSTKFSYVTSFPVLKHLPIRTYSKPHIECTPLPLMSRGAAGSFVLWKSLYVPLVLTDVGYMFLSRAMAPPSFHLGSVLKKSQRAVYKTVDKYLSLRNTCFGWKSVLLGSKLSDLYASSNLPLYKE